VHSFEQDGITLIYWDIDEEQAIAQLTIDLILLVCLEYNHYEWLRNFFIKKSQGYLMEVDEFIKLTDIVQYYQNLDVVVNMPDLPFRTAFIPKRTKTNSDIVLTKEEANLQDRAFHARLWKEVWERNPKLHQWDVFNPFPGDHMFELAEKARRQDWDSEAELRNEEMFWKEVKKIEREYEISREQAILVVSDYIPRGLMKDGTKMVEALAQKGDSEMTLSERLDKMFAEPDPVDAPWEEKT